MPDNIPSFPYFLGSLIRAIAHFLREGFGLTTSYAMLGEAYKGFTREQVEQAGSIAEKLVAISNRWQDLQPLDDLSTILQGEQQPGPEVYINFHVLMAPEESTDPGAEGIWRTIQWRGSWQTSKQQILRDVEGMIDEREWTEMRDALRNWIPHTADVGSLIWFQHPDQL